MTHYHVINHHRGLIVCFSPKCACNTLRDWFKHSLSDQEIHDWQAISQHMIPTEEFENYSDYSRILFLRDPFRRLVSFYCQWVVRNDTDWCFADDDKNHGLRGKSFSELVCILEDLAEQGIAFQHHLKPQMSNVERVKFDLVIPIEDLAAQLTEVNQELGVKYEAKTFNATPYDETLASYVYDAAPQSLARDGIPPCRYFYNAELAGKVERIYRSDLARYRKYFGDGALFEQQVPLRESA